MSVICILDIQTWWEVPSIAYFCSLFRTAFNLVDFDVEELEEALLTEGAEDSSTLVTELIVRLLNGCLGNSDISAFNYQMYLRRLFRRKCQNTKLNPFNTDIDFQFLPLRTKVEILQALCDFRLDAGDVSEIFRNLQAESLRVEPLGFDSNKSVYWYFYGTRLYREDIISKSKHKHRKLNQRNVWAHGTKSFYRARAERIWQVVCFTEDDWNRLTEKFKNSSSKVEKELYRSLSENFLPELPKLFAEKKRLQQKRLRLLIARRSSTRVVEKAHQKREQQIKEKENNAKAEVERKLEATTARAARVERRNLIKSQARTPSEDSNEQRSKKRKEMPQKELKKDQKKDLKKDLKKDSKDKQKRGYVRKAKVSSANDKSVPLPDPPLRTGRKTNNSLASATGQILIPDNDVPVSSTRLKLKTSQM